MRRLRDAWDIGWEVVTLAGLLLVEIVRQPAPEELTQEQIAARRQGSTPAPQRQLTEKQADEMLRADVDAHNRARDEMRQPAIQFGGQNLVPLHHRPGIADATYAAMREARRELHLSECWLRDGGEHCTCFADYPDADSG